MTSNKHIICQCEDCKKERLEMSEAIKMAKALMEKAKNFQFEETARIAKAIPSQTDKVQ